MMELEAKWLVSAYDYFKDNGSIIRNGFGGGLLMQLKGKSYENQMKTHSLTLIETVIGHFELFCINFLE